MEYTFDNDPETIQQRDDLSQRLDITLGKTGILNEYSPESAKKVWKIIADTTIDIRRMLNLPNVKFGLKDNPTGKMLKSPAATVPTLIADKDENGRVINPTVVDLTVEFDPIFLRTVAANFDHHPLAGEILGDLLMQLTAHEMFHVRQITKYTNSMMASSAYTSEELGITQYNWHESKYELAAQLFALGYMRTKPERNDFNKTVRPATIQKLVEDIDGMKEINNQKGGDTT